MFTSTCIRTAVFLVFAASLPAAAIIDFQTVPSGTVTPFSVTNGGITATFSSPDGGVFTASSFDFELLPYALYDSDPPFHALDIAFSEPIMDVSFNFAVNSRPSGTLFLDAFLGADSVGSTSETIFVPPDRFRPQGHFFFQAPAFDRIRLTSDAQDFAVDLIRTNVLPEPSSLSLMVAGGVMVLVTQLRKRSRRSTRQIR